jgi:hypothetical protein
VKPIIGIATICSKRCWYYISVSPRPSPAVVSNFLWLQLVSAKAVHAASVRIRTEGREGAAKGREGKGRAQKEERRAEERRTQRRARGGDRSKRTSRGPIRISDRFVPATEGKGREEKRDRDKGEQRGGIRCVCCRSSPRCACARLFGVAWRSPELSRREEGGNTQSTSSAQSLSRLSFPPFVALRYERTSYAPPLPPPPSPPSSR